MYVPSHTNFTVTRCARRFQLSVKVWPCARREGHTAALRKSTAVMHFQPLTSRGKAAKLRERIWILKNSGKVCIVHKSCPCWHEPKSTFDQKQKKRKEKKREKNRAQLFSIFPIFCLYWHCFSLFFISFSHFFHFFRLFLFFSFFSLLYFHFFAVHRSFRFWCAVRTEKQTATWRWTALISICFMKITGTLLWENLESLSRVQACEKKSVQPVRFVGSSSLIRHEK